MSHWQQQPGPDPYQPEASFPPLPPLPGQEPQGPAAGYGPPPAYGPQPGYGPPAFGPQPQPPRRGSGAGLWIGLGVGAFVLLLIVGCVGAVVFFQSSGDDDSPTTAGTAANDPGRNGAAGPPPTGGISTPPPAAGVPVGQPAKMQSLEFTVTAKPTCGTTVVAGATPRRGQFCLVPIKVANKGGAAVRWSTAYATLYVTARDYHSPSLACANNGGLEDDASVAAGGSWETKACYDMPTGQTPVRVRFTEQNRGDEAFVDLA